MTNRTTRATAVLGAALLVGGVFGPATALPATAAEPAAASVDLVDGQATEATRSLFSYLQDVRGEGTLFGHQHTTDYGESFDTRDGALSDVKAATSDYPAVFGFDALIIEGRERPGVADATREQNALTLAQSIREAHDLGGISTLSAHVENFVTGGDFYDTSGDTLRAVLPGGEKNSELTAYLDLIALAADNAVDADGNAIPIIFRPWHENAGSWFWWGAAFGSPGEYAELYRYTVEYLRDVKGVHNLLYAFSPGGGFGGDADLYLRTYPGDDYIDVLGYDTYDASASSTFLAGLVDDLGMIATLADQKGKISAFTEFGITGGVKADGQNANPHWYRDVLAAIKADPEASRSAYMLTWANFGGSTDPYTPTSGEMLSDFQQYYDDPFTLFASDVTGEYDQQTTAVAQAPTAHLASPASGTRVASASNTLRASVQGFPDADRVTVTVGDQTVDLQAPADGSLWWTADWTVPAALLDNSTRTLRLRVLDGSIVLNETESRAVFGPRPVQAPGVVDDFEGYGDTDALLSEYVQYGANTISLENAANGSVGDGSRALRLDYSFATQSYTGIGTQVSGDWSNFWDFQAWIDADGSNNKMVLQLVADGVSFEAYPSLASDGASLVTIPFADWRPAPWDTAHADARLTPERLQKVTQFNIYVNAVDGAATSGSIIVDSLRAVVGTPPPTSYSDVPRDRADYAAIEWLHDEVIDLGDKKGKFHPTKSLKDEELEDVVAAYDDAAPAPQSARRLDVVTALWSLAGSPQPQTSVTFKDVSAEEALAVAWAIEQGLVEADSPKKFGANKRVSRADIARWLQQVDEIRTAEAGTVISDFEDGAQGWSLASWQTNGGAVAASAGRLIVDSGTGGSWISRSGGDLTGRTALLLDVSATSGLDAKVALQLGADWTWCETEEAGRTDAAGTIVVDLTTMNAECQAMLGEVRGINVFLGEGHHELGAVSIR